MLLLAASLALAHQPWVAEEGQYSEPQGAWPMDDIGLSIVVYDQLTCEYPALWLRFEAQGGEELYTQLGMPLLDRQIAWRPSMAVLAPGFPAPPADLPFEVPAGLGAVVYDSAAVTDLGTFDEPFTGTSSWVLRTETLELPAGEGYVVAWDPAGLTGKLWVATGTREEFDSEDFERIGDLIDDIRAFHELDGAPAGELLECAADEGPGDTGDGDGAGDALDAEATGCGVPVGGVSPALVGLVGLLAARRRR